jgi:hypothetical protein
VPSRNTVPYVEEKSACCIASSPSIRPCRTENPRDETRRAGWEVAKIQVFDPPTNKTSILGTLSENHGCRWVVACQRRVRTLRVKRGHKVQGTMEGANSFLF